MKVKQMVIAAVFLWLLAIAGISNANAAQLTVLTPNKLVLITANKCATASLATTVSGTPSSGGTVYPAVLLSNIPVACQGLLTELWVHGAGGTVLASATATPAAATQVFATGNYTAANVTSVVVRVNGWVFPTTWTAPPPPGGNGLTCKAVNNGGNTTNAACTVTITGVSHWISYPGAWGVGTPYEHVYLSFEVTTNQNRWEVTFDFSDTTTFPGSGFTPTYVGDGYNVIKAPTYSCSSLPTFVAWKGAGNVSGQNNGNIFWTNHPTTTNGTVQLCP
ncbi:MAG: hypothetical protein CVT64_00075 [Actinobacteria bacterium HGW-Actinobacteria-4]|nr:MAG: hypothetical protein CVT64_00075 [Actinobacteria bacterium HGW-Actinobacteria-4]